MSTISNHNNENWPYHPYDGSKPELQGSYVPCANNPCSEHGGSDVYASSPEEAYAKAHQNDTWGFTINKSMLTNENNDTSIIKQSEHEPDSTTDNKQSSISSKISAKAKLIISKITSNSGKSVKLTRSKKLIGYTTKKAKEIAMEQGLYIDGSPLLHRLTDDEKNKYFIKAPKGYPISGGINMQTLARDIFPGAILANDDIDGIKARSMNAFDKATDSEREAIKAYTDENYEYINKLLRTGSLGPEYSPEFVKRINSYIKHINSFMHHHATMKVIDKDTIVFRRRFISQHNQSRGYEEQAFYKAVAKSLKDGSEPIITRPDYMSASWDVPAMFFENTCSYIIKIPAGTRGIDVSEEGMHASEKEFMIDKGYKFKVAGIYELSKLKSNINSDNKRETAWHEDGYPVIALELIPN